MAADLLPRFRRLFTYDEWANREALASLRRAGAPPPRALKWLGHVLGAERLWLGRLQQDPKAVAVWPELTLDQCAGEIADLARLWQDYLNARTPEQLSRPIPYVNTKGESYTNTVEDILMHVVIHSAYHRGQIAADVRASGHTPAYTDFIHGVRQGLVE